MPKVCEFRSSDRCGFLERNLNPCPSCPFRDILVSLKALPPGPQGEQGVPGHAGKDGPTGARGASGTQGDKGPIGSIGSKGLTGLTGPQGLRGLPGPKGEKGAKGGTGAEGTVDKELLKRLIESQLGSGGRGQVLLGWNRGASGAAGGDLAGTYPNPTVARKSLRYAYLV